MATPDARTRMIDAQDRLLDLLFQREEANAARDRDRAIAVTSQIEAAKQHCDRLRAQYQPGVDKSC